MRLLVLLALLALSACGDGGSQASEDPDPTPPTPGDYVAVTLPEPYAAGDLLRLTVRDDGISFRATCNSFFGSADWDGGVLAVGQVGGTEMGCPGAGAAQDEWLVDFLTSRPTYAFDGEGLELTGADAVVSLVPADQVPPDAGARPGLTLEDTRWLLTDIAENTDQASSVTAVPAGVRSTLVLTGGRLEAFLGCNQARGDADVVRDRIELGPLMTTRMACPGPEGEVEQQVSAVLEGSVPWSITGDRLTLGAGELQLIYAAGS